LPVLKKQSGFGAAMAEVQLRGFPKWTENEDLKYTVAECGYPVKELRINAEATLASVTLPSWEAADAVVQRLHKFEFTPGYPLQARIKPGQQRTEDAAAAAPAGGKGKDGKGKGKPSSSKGTGKPADKGVKGAAKSTMKAAPSAAPKAAPQAALVATTDGNSVTNCLDAGRIDGWFVNTKKNVLERGWGQVQSYCFDGDLCYRPVNSPLLKDVEFAQKDAVSFEVVMIGDQCEAVRLTTLEVEHLNSETPIVPVQTFSSSNGQQGDELGDEFASEKSQKRRQREEADARCLFFGGFGAEISEETLQKFAEQAGEVKNVKIFLNTATWESKGCGKIMYAELDAAERAVNELSGTVLNQRIVTIEPLGQSSNTNPNPKRAKPTPPKQPDVLFTDGMPKQLPLSMFSKDDTPQKMLDICYAAFEDLLYNHDAEATGHSMIIMIRQLVFEVNDLFGEDETSLQTWFGHLRQCQWFRENDQMVKWQASKKRVNISKVNSGAAPARPWFEVHQMARQQVDQRVLEQQRMGKPIFEVPEEEKAKARPNPLDLMQKGKGKGK